MEEQHGGLVVKMLAFHSEGLAIESLQFYAELRDYGVIKKEKNENKFKNGSQNVYILGIF